MDFVEISTETIHTHTQNVRITILIEIIGNGWRFDLYGSILFLGFLLLLLCVWHQTIRQCPCIELELCNWIYYVACFMLDTMPECTLEKCLFREKETVFIVWVNDAWHAANVSMHRQFASCQTYNFHFIEMKPNNMKFKQLSLYRKTYTFS